MLTVQVWDKRLVGAVEKAIRDCGPGPQPAADGQMVRVPIPQLTDRAAQRAGQDRAQICRGRAGGGAQRAPRRHGADQGLREEARDRRGRGKDWQRRGAEADRRTTSSGWTRRWPRRKRTSARSDAGRDAGDQRRIQRRRCGAGRAGARRRRCRRHVAIIMDGNGRWAAARRLPRIAGHRDGARAVRRTIEAAIRQRRRLADALRLLQRELAPAGGRGARPDRPAAPLSAHRDRRAAGATACGCASSATATASIPTSSATWPTAERDDRRQHRLNLTVALSYGARAEIVAAARAMAEAARPAGSIPAALDEAVFAALARHRRHARPRPDHPHLAASSGCPTSCSGRRPMPNWCSWTCCGRISGREHFAAALAEYAGGSGASARVLAETADRMRWA